MNDVTLKVFVGCVAALVSGIIAILLYFLKRKDDELTLVKNKISEEKYNTYFDIISLFFDLLNQQKGLVKISQKELTIRYINIKKNLLLLASDEILNKFSDFDKNITTDRENKDLKKIGKWLELFVLIRRDSGNPNTKINSEEILRMIMNDEDYDEIQRLIFKK